MCLQCGCGMLDDNMGVGTMGVDESGKGMTQQTIEVAASAFGIPKQQAIDNIIASLEEMKKQDKS